MFTCTTTLSVDLTSNNSIFTLNGKIYHKDQMTLCWMLHFCQPEIKYQFNLANNNGHRFVTS